MDRHVEPGVGNLLGAVDLALSDGLEICIVGDPDDDATGTLLHEVFRRYLPNRVVACGKDSELHLLKGRTQGMFSRAGEA